MTNKQLRRKNFKFVTDSGMGDADFIEVFTLPNEEACLYTVVIHSDGSSDIINKWD